MFLSCGLGGLEPFRSDPTADSILEMSFYWAPFGLVGSNGYFCDLERALLSYASNESTCFCLF